MLDWQLRGPGFESKDLIQINGSFGICSDEFTIIPNKPLTIPPMFDLKDPNSNENQHNVENN